MQCYADVMKSSDNFYEDPVMYNMSKQSGIRGGVRKREAHYRSPDFQVAAT